MVVISKPSPELISVRVNYKAYKVFKMLVTQLNSIRGNWTRFETRKRNKRFLAAQKKILLRDKFTCRYCEFKTEKYLNIVNADQNYSNNKSKNLVSACPFCSQCFFLDCVGKAPKTGGHVIYLPEITQAQINNFCRVLFATMLKDAPYKGKLHTIYLSFKDRGKIVEEIFGPESSKPAIFGQTLIDSNLDTKKSDKSIIKDLRLLPSREPFKEEILYWKSLVYDTIPL